MNVSQGDTPLTYIANITPLQRQGIRQLLEREATFEVVSEADNGLDAVRLTREFKPDVIIMEPRMPKLGGVEAIRRVKAEHPQAAVLILTMYDKEDYVVELLGAGAGYLLKTAYSEQLVEAIRSVRAGEFVCNPAVMQKLLKHIARAHPVAVDFGEHLTRRELDVLKLARGDKCRWYVSLQDGPELQHRLSG
jgi:DNA-binding NarL/FixJ family response regulator